MSQKKSEHSGRFLIDAVALSSDSSTARPIQLAEMYSSVFDNEQLVLAPCRDVPQNLHVGPSGVTYVASRWSG
jgi:hypothetical protein